MPTYSHAQLLDLTNAVGVTYPGEPTDAVTLGGYTAYITAEDNPSNPLTDWETFDRVSSWTETWHTGNLEGTDWADDEEAARDAIYAEVQAAHYRNGYPDAEDYSGKDWAKYRDSIIDRHAILAAPVSLSADRGSSWGVIVWTLRETKRQDYGVKRLTTATVERDLAAQVETLRQYVEGDIYVAVLKDSGGDTVESVGDVYGLETAREYLAEFLGGELNRDELDRLAKLKAMILNRAPLHARLSLAS